MKFLVRPQLKWVYSDGEIVVLHRKYTTIIILLEQLRAYSIQYSIWNDFTHKNICSAEAGLHCFGENSAEVRSTVSTGAPSHSVPLILRTKIRWRGPQHAERVKSHCVKQTYPKERAGHRVWSRHAARSFQSFHRHSFSNLPNVIIYAKSNQAFRDQPNGCSRVGIVGVLRERALFP